MNASGKPYRNPELSPVIPLANARNLRIHPLSQEGEHAYA